jgi:hypothetical protein
MKEEFTYADAIKSLEKKLEASVSSQEITQYQANTIKPWLLSILNPKTSIEDKIKVCELIEGQVIDGLLSEEQAMGLLFTTINLEVQALNSSLEDTIEHTRNTLASIEIGQMPTANRRPI